MLHRGEAVLRKHLRRKLRTFEENQKSNIIRTTKGKRTLLLKFRQFYSAKNTRRDTHESRKPFFPKYGYSVLGLKKPHFKTKIIHFEKSHDAENCKRGPLRPFEIHAVAKFQPLETLKNLKKKQHFYIRSVAKYQKLKGGRLGTLENFRKSHNAEKRGSLIVPKK